MSHRLMAIFSPCEGWVSKMHLEDLTLIPNNVCLLVSPLRKLWKCAVLGLSLCLTSTKEVFHARSMGAKKKSRHTHAHKQAYTFTYPNGCKWFLCTFLHSHPNDLKITNSLLSACRHTFPLWAFQQSHTGHSTISHPLTRFLPRFSF